ncbi:MAG TPA: thioesterase domain-containing protein [Thermoanaerobaculia bacterium]|nr:thioesterase domain-containing protein [Thermoanaerobaculia bacterium]
MPASEPPPEPSPASGPEPPRDVLEPQLARLFEAVLGSAGRVGPRVDAESGFFALGGDSMAAIDLAERVERRWGVAVPLGRFLPDLTVASLAAHLRDAGVEEPGPGQAGAARAGSGQGTTGAGSSAAAEREPGAGAGEVAAGSPLVAIQPQGGRPPFFCVHPSGGSVLCYLELARRLGPEQPFWGLQGPDPRHAVEPPGSVEAMAGHYLEALRAAFPRGPYRLGGYSFGGYVAFEMARRLAAAGEPPAVVVLLDTRAPSALAAGAAQPEGGLVADLAAVLERHDLDSADPGAEDERRLWDDLRDLAEEHLRSVWREGDPPPGRRRRLGEIQRFFRDHRFLPAAGTVDYPQVRRYLRFLRAYFRASRAYAPQPYPGAVSLLLATDRLTPAEADPETHAAGWSRLAAGGLTVRRVPGHHLAFVTPPAVASVAVALEEVLRP